MCDAMPWCSGSLHCRVLRDNLNPDAGVHPHVFTVTDVAWACPSGLANTENAGVLPSALTVTDVSCICMDQSFWTEMP